MDFNFKDAANLSDSYDDSAPNIIDEIKASDEYKSLDLTTHKGQNEAAWMLEPESDFWLATCDGLMENEQI